MELILQRDYSTLECTMGSLHKSVAGNSEFLCYTLEDRGPIRSGRYRIQIEHSSEWDIDMPILKDINEIIHFGSDGEDADGGILVGEIRGPGFLLESKPAFDRVKNIILDAIEANNPVYITIKN